MSSPTVNDPKGEAGAKKAPMWLLPPVALELTAWALKEGSEKYGPWNWRRTGVCASTYVSAIMRHLNAWRDGEDDDPDLPGVSHIAKIAACCNILLDAAACGTLQDDRNKRPTSRFDEHKQAFRDILGGMTKEELIADLESRMPSEPPPDPKKFIDLDGELVELPPVPEGYDRWVYRGRGWRVERPVTYACYPGTDGGWVVHHDDRYTCGAQSLRYIEAIKDDDCQKAIIAPLPREALFAAIEPGDYVEGWLVHGQEFDGRVTNILDVRGTKVFHFSDRSPLTEDEIYSITRA